MKNLRNLRAHNSEEGFTLVELMIVVVIIGILAAIAIPVFANQQTASIRASVKSDVKNTQVALNTYLVKNLKDTNMSYQVQGNYATGTLSVSSKLGIIPTSQDNVIKIRASETIAGDTDTPAAFDNYVIIGWNDKLGLNSYRYTFDSTTGTYKEGGTS